MGIPDVHGGVGVDHGAGIVIECFRGIPDVDGWIVLVSASALCIYMFHSIELHYRIGVATLCYPSGLCYPLSWYRS